MKYNVYVDGALVSEFVNESADKAKVTAYEVLQESNARNGGFEAATFECEDSGVVWNYNFESDWWVQ